jgi:hypothetical protein
MNFRDELPSKQTRTRFTKQESASVEKMEKTFEQWHSFSVKENS